MIYLDSEDSFYPRNHEQEKTKPQYSKNDERTGKISLILIIAFVTYIIWTIFDAYAFGESDFILEAKVNEAALSLDVKRFEISGESDKEICPSGLCKINLQGYTYFSAPTPESMGISYTVDFTVKDNQTDSNLGAKKKEFLEQFTANMIYCRVDDIIEENGQELYYCHDTSNTITRKFDSESWTYDTTGVYDAKNHMLKVTGNLTRGSSYSLNTTNDSNTTNTVNMTEAIKNNVENETPRTFEDCFSDGMGTFTLGLIFAPTEELSVTDLLDPAFKTMIINMCNFYHEKTGEWINMMSEEQQQYSKQYGDEFYQKYGDTFPEKLKEYMKSNQTR